MRERPAGFCEMLMDSEDLRAGAAAYAVGH
jgi:hypothetical protein